MALTATMHHWTITLSDVDRGVYETLDLRLAQHPSESTRYLLTRVIAYCLSYEEGIAFSKAGLGNSDDPPVAVTDLTGVLRAWIDVGAPSAERLHKASKAADRVALFTSVDRALLLREAGTRRIHKVEDIAVWHIAPAFLAAMESRVNRTMAFELVRNDGQLYATVQGSTVEGTIERGGLV